MLENQYNSIKRYNKYIEEELQGKKEEERKRILDDMFQAADIAINKHKSDKEYDLTNKIVKSIRDILVAAIAYFGVSSEIEKLSVALGKDKYGFLLSFIPLVILIVSIFWLLKSFINADYNSQIRECEAFQYCVSQKKIQEDKIKNNSVDNSVAIDLDKTKDDEANKSKVIKSDNNNSSEGDKENLSYSNDGFLKKIFKTRLRRKKIEMKFIYINQILYDKKD